jgi:asparagine synthase (glutamine-hydrolysing)
MCGIAGIWSPGLRVAERTSIVRRMAGCLAHRGPDAEGFWVPEDAPLAFGHRRLAVVDLTESGTQPMRSASGRWIIVFNGEIYNYRELRRELRQLGVVFRGASDTEVLLAAIEEWGITRALRRCVGMFAIGLWDVELAELHIARDRLGEKPLYYASIGSTFAFSSELKALRSHPDWIGTVDRDALALFLRHTHVPAPLSIYEGVRKVRPGTVISLRLGGGIIDPIETVYWSAVQTALSAEEHRLAEPDDVLLDRVEDALSATISDQMIADVPLGAFLSGGIDSSLIVALMQRQSSKPVRTFTIGFSEGEFNEAHYAKAVATHLGTEHTEYVVTPREALDVIPLLPRLYDEPFGDSSQIPTYLVSRLARRDVTVALSGDGGDELFGGYARYAEAERLWARLNTVPFRLRTGAARALRTVPDAQWDSLLHAIAMIAPQRLRLDTPGKVGRFSRLLSRDTREALYGHVASTWDDPTSVVLGSNVQTTAFSEVGRSVRLRSFREQMMLLDVVSYLPDDIMVKVDRAAMGVSLETRAPFLDHRFVELTMRLPFRMKVRDGVSKWTLRQLLCRHVPTALIDRPKMGFGVPMGDWLRGPLRPWAEELLSTRRLETEGYFDAGTIRSVWRDHLRGRSSYSGHLWPVLMFQAWLAEHAARSAVAA